MVRVALVLVLLASLVRAQPAAPAHDGGDVVALLPLDTDKRLELYGQPVASEMARALGAAGLAVVVVGPKMAVPERAQLVIDGMITSKGEAVGISIRIRERTTGTTLDTLAATAPSLESIDAAAAELSARVLPSVKQQIVALHEREHVEPSLPRPLEKLPPTPAAEPAVSALVAVEGRDPLRAALAAEVSRWAAHHHHEATRVDPPALARKQAPQAVASAHAELAIAFEIRGYTPIAGKVPMARARVHVRIADGARVVFDRTVRTDTIVGEKAISADDLAARVAREVTAIVEPHVRRAFSTWR